MRATKDMFGPTGVVFLRAYWISLLMGIAVSVALLYWLGVYDPDSPIHWFRYYVGLVTLCGLAGAIVGYIIFRYLTRL
jgi:hypothetical protein